MHSPSRPCVSVCIATYNQVAYIERCVASVLAQEGEIALEVLVGDDGSTDGTGEALEALLQRHPGRFELIRRPTNIGGTENYQDLVRRARGVLIAHLDGDDAWLPGKLMAQTRFIAAHPECVAVYCNADVVDNSGVALGRFTNAHPPVMGLAYLAARGNFLMHSSLLYRAEHRDVFTQLDPPVIDYLIHLGLARRGSLGFIDEPLALYRHATATSTVRNAFPLVQQLLWQAVGSALPNLAPPERIAAVSHFVAGIVISRVLGKAGGAGPLIGRAAAAVDVPAWQLVARSIPHVLRIVACHGLQTLLRRMGRRDSLVLHARI